MGIVPYVLCLIYLVSVSFLKKSSPTLVLLGKHLTFSAQFSAMKTTLTKHIQLSTSNLIELTLDLM